jgi:hypothetical protein
MALTYDWAFEDERKPIHVYPVKGLDGRKLLCLDCVTLNDGSQVIVHIAPLTVDDDEFVQSLSDSNGHESNIKLICHLCVKWGDQDFVVAEDINAELQAVSDVGGTIAEYFPKRTRTVKGQRKSAESDISPKRRQLRGVQPVAETASQ